MPAKKDKNDARPDEGSIAGKLATLRGRSSGLNIDELDGTVLWLATTELARRGASITLGTTQDKQSWVCQLWDGKFPVKDYFRDTGELNRHLAALVRAARGNEVSQEVDQILQGYGW